MLREARIQPSSVENEDLVLTDAQRGAIHVGKLDCPAHGRPLGERLAMSLRLLLRRQPSWIDRPLANPKLEALRLLVCLQRYPDDALDTVVRTELETEFTARQLELLTAIARQTSP